MELWRLCCSNWIYLFWILSSHDFLMLFLHFFSFSSDRRQSREEIKSVWFYPMLINLQKTLSQVNQSKSSLLRRSGDFWSGFFSYFDIRRATCNIRKATWSCMAQIWNATFQKSAQHIFCLYLNSLLTQLSRNLFLDMHIYYILYMYICI